MTPKRNQTIKNIVLVALMYLSIVGYLSMFNIVNTELHTLLILRNILINLGVLALLTVGIVVIITFIQKKRTNGIDNYKKNLRKASMCVLGLIMAMGYILHIEFQPNNVNKLILLSLPLMGIVMVKLTRPKESTRL